MYELRSEGLDGKQEFFTKPWAMTTLMFVGMSFCLPLSFAERRSRRNAATAAAGAEPLLLPGNGHEVRGEGAGVSESEGRGCAGVLRLTQRQNASLDAHSMLAGGAREAFGAA